jgi:Leucine-rich repeat (LRR) protein
LTNLVHLHLNWNQLTAVPDEIGSCTCLEELQLSYNKLRMIPQSFSDLTNLRFAGKCTVGGLPVVFLFVVCRAKLVMRLVGFKPDQGARCSVAKQPPRAPADLPRQYAQPPQAGV